MTIKMAFIVAAAHAALKAQATKINALNVYPVPDGDTGTNMLLTLESILKETKSKSYESVETAVKAGARAALMGARGNSGVILSQMIRGGCEVLAKRATFTAEDFADALDGARERAYSSTREPVEGTMLTVIKDAATAAREALKVKGSDLPSVVKAAAKEAHASVKRTPQKLAVLKDAGVVDAGGLGVAVILDGLHACLSGQKIEDAPIEDLEEANALPDLDAIHANEEAWGYCTEFIVTGFSGDAEEFEEEIHNSGKSVLVISDDDLVKVHLHTQNPGGALAYAGGFGRLMGVKIDDMEAQVEYRTGVSEESRESPPTNLAVVAASRGDGSRELFEAMGAAVIEGGQGANPSANDFARAVEETGAESVILLPNNKNIVPTAEQVGELVEADVYVVPTKTIASGLSVMVGFDAEGEADEVVEEMVEICSHLKAAEITYAVRDANVNGREVPDGACIGILDGELVSVEESVEGAALEVAETMLSDGADIVTLLRGEGMEDGELDRIVAGIENIDEDIEVDVRDGGQPLYPLQMVAE
ncbi:MAG: DAK2 domain-containing protein [Actinomycetota bacterium]|jgi:DAK2 domain fusion protein YloV|nr:DAK2 domain-containing protein [Rubrobacter sp.]MDQ3507549.1 DAK2 domain-containing protein [Actinomycetota bacterium]